MILHLKSMWYFCSNTGVLKIYLFLLNSMLGVSLYVCVGGGGGIQSHLSWYKFWNKNGLMKLEILILTQTGVDSEQNF